MLNTSNTYKINVHNSVAEHAQPLKQEMPADVTTMELRITLPRLLQAGISKNLQAIVFIEILTQKTSITVLI